MECFLEETLWVKAVLHPNQAEGSGEKMQFMEHPNLILAACLWRRCLITVWTTSRCCQSDQMMSLVPENSPLPSLSHHNAPHRQRGGGVDVCGILYPHTAWCLGWGPLQRSKIRISSFWLTRSLPSDRWVLPRSGFSRQCLRTGLGTEGLGELKF